MASLLASQVGAPCLTEMFDARLGGARAQFDARARAGRRHEGANPHAWRLRSIRTRRISLCKIFWRGHKSARVVQWRISLVAVSFRI